MASLESGLAPDQINNAIAMVYLSRARKNANRVRMIPDDAIERFGDAVGLSKVVVDDLVGAGIRRQLPPSITTPEAASIGRTLPPSILASSDPGIVSRHVSESWSALNTLNQLATLHNGGIDVGVTIDIKDNFVGSVDLTTPSAPVDTVDPNVIGWIADEAGVTLAPAEWQADPGIPTLVQDQFDQHVNDLLPPATVSEAVQLNSVTLTLTDPSLDGKPGLVHRIKVTTITDSNGHELFQSTSMGSGLEPQVIPTIHDVHEGLIDENVSPAEIEDLLNGLPVDPGAVLRAPGGWLYAQNQFRKD